MSSVFGEWHIEKGTELVAINGPSYNLSRDITAETIIINETCVIINDTPYCNVTGFWYSFPELNYSKTPKECEHHSDCGTCEKCVNFSCDIQASSEDIKEECTAEYCYTGNCDGYASSCGIVNNSKGYCGLCLGCTDQDGECDFAGSGSDVWDECDAVDCSSFFWGWDGYYCYGLESYNDSQVDCYAPGLCEGEELCTDKGPVYSECNCSIGQSGCYNSTPSTCNLTKCSAPFILSIDIQTSAYFCDLYFGVSEPSNYTLSFGTSSLNYTQKINETKFLVSYSQLLSNLKNFTTYFLQFDFCDDQGQCNSSKEYNFTTLKKPVMSSDEYFSFSGFEILMISGFSIMILIIVSGMFALNPDALGWSLGGFAILIIMISIATTIIMGVPS